MKKCPFCAEDIQDAAIVCKHCGRELQGANVGAVTVKAKSRGPWLVVAVFFSLGVLGLLAFVLAGVTIFDSRYVTGGCRLSAAVTPYNAPGGGVLAITNRESASWPDAQITIYGQITSGPDQGPAGAHKLQRTIEPGLNAIDLKDFQNAEGTRWVPLMMRVEGVGVAAEHCRVELSFDK